MENRKNAKTPKRQPETCGRRSAVKNSGTLNTGRKAAAAAGKGIGGRRGVAPEEDKVIGALARAKRQREKKKKSMAAIIICAVAVLSVILTVAGYLIWYRPSISNTPRFPTDGGSTGTGDDYVPVIQSDFTRKDRVYNFLVIGIDKAATQADVLMLVSFNAAEDTLNVVSLPRDTYIDADGRSSHRINAYLAGSYALALREDDAEPYVTAIESFVSMVESNLCVQIDNYICMDTAGFRDIINALGGLDIDVPFDMEYEDPEQNLYIHLKAGPQHLDGAQAEQFVRFRKAYATGDIGRISAQKIFLTALANQIKENLSVEVVTETVKALMNYVTTDLSVLDAVYYVKEAYDVPLSSIRYITMPGMGVRSPSGASFYVLYRENALDIVNRYLNVFADDIQDEIFDSKNVFGNVGASYIDEVYQTPYQDLDNDILSAEDVDKNSVDIPIIE